MTRCRLHILKAGACRHPAASTRAGASLRAAVYPALVGLILHPSEGAILFDTGYDPAFFTATRTFPERLYRWTTPVDLPRGEAAADQLKRLGLAPGDVRAVIASHFHGDHVAGLHAFPDAALYCARAGLEQVQRSGRLARVRRGVLSALVPEALAAGARFFEDLPRVPLGSELHPFESGADLFGDGSLLAVELPGHCPGHWGLVLRDESDQRVFLVADAAWSRAAIRDDAPPPRVTTALLGHTATYRTTLKTLNALWTRNPTLKLTPSHCPEAASEAMTDGD
jgi:glyoxylase-like metal-dependent hydrolase (beta-lactamase superfamily II)